MYKEFFFLPTRASMVPQTVEQVTTKKTEEAVDYMKMGLVKEIRKNGAIGM